VQDTAALDRYLKLCKYRKLLLLAKNKQREVHSTRARNSSPSEPEGKPELSSVEKAIAKSSYCVAEVGAAGLGVFALETIPAGSFLWMYEGKRMRTGDRNESQAARFIARQGGDIRYCVGCEGGVVIDASQGGNDSRFVNHFEGAWGGVGMFL
jgi:SET domain-containing protein